MLGSFLWKLEEKYHDEARSYMHNAFRRISRVTPWDHFIVVNDFRKIPVLDLG